MRPTTLFTLQLLAIISALVLGCSAHITILPGNDSPKTLNGSITPDNNDTKLHGGAKPPSGSNTTSGDPGIYDTLPTTSDPAKYGLPVPNPAPSLPAAFTPFTAPDIATGGYAPQIAAIMPTAAADETVPMTGVDFTADTRFELYTQTGEGPSSSSRWYPIT